MSTKKKHTILLIQFTNSRATRTYADYESVTEAMSGICQLFEEKLKKENPNTRNITYDIRDLYNYIDGLGDLACLVYSPQNMAYTPHNKEWIKERVLAHLKKMAEQQQ